MKILKEIFIKNKLKILTYILLFIILLGVANTKVYHTGLAPFGVSLVFSLMFVKLNGYVLALVYFLSSMCVPMTPNVIGFSLIVGLMLVVLQFIVSYKNITLKKLYIFIISGVSYLIYIAINFSSGKENLALLVSVILGMLFLYSCLTFLDATINRRLMNKLNLDEKLAGGVILLIFIIGMSCVNLWNVNLGLSFVTLIILISTFIVTPSVLLVLAVVMGIAFSVTTLNLMYVSLFLILTVVSLSFKCNYKIFSAIAYLGGYVIALIVFDMGINKFEIISVLLGVLIFIFIPFKLLKDVAEHFDIKSHIIVKNIINRSKKQLVNRVQQLSKVFEEMTQVYRDMVRGLIPDEDAMKLLKEELLCNVCDRCSNKDNCYRTSSNFVEHSIDVLITCGYSKGKVLLTDLPASLSSNCIRVNELLGSLNNLITSYKDYTSAITNLDTSRVLIADQLYGVSKLLDSLSSEVDININFDSRFENRIKEDLSYKNIICLECAIYEKDIDTKIVNLIVKSDTINEKVIEKIVSKIIGVKLMITSIEQSDIAGASIINMCVRPNYDMVFGATCITKSGRKISGDNHSVIKIDDGKYMVSICDGMGSGKNANKISSLSISLIENFYRAGFDNEIILSSVNKLLSLNEEENFSTIDLCVIDGKKNVYDFIKLGATDGYIKRHKGEVETIKSSGLPVGMLDEITPHITKRLVSPFDILVFMSDGVADAFENKINFENYLYNLDIINPQTLSDEIMNKALELNGNIANDDMTVVCVRVFEWV